MLAAFKRLVSELTKATFSFTECLRHPSLNINKMEGHKSIWEARITKGYRMTLQIVGDTCLLRRVGTHSVLKRP
jgi:hypothetical protein